MEDMPPAKRANVSGNTALIQANHDRLLVDPFFQRIAKLIQSKSLQWPNNIAFITVNHVVRTLPPYIKGLQQLGRVAAIIPKGSHQDPSVSNQVNAIAPQAIKAVSRDTFNNPAQAIAFIKQQLKPNEQLILIDIGAYFAPCLTAFAQDAQLMQQLIGIVEDTENGHQAYLQQLTQQPSAFPLFSVARSRLKEAEDYNVGKSIVMAADTLLRDTGHSTLQQMQVIGVLGFGKIGKSIAQHLRNLNVRRVIVYEINHLIHFLADANDFEITQDRDWLLANADMLFCASGNRSLGDNDFGNLKNNAFIASCTSSDSELDLTWLEQNITSESTTKNITAFELTNGKYINMLARGNAVNFIYGGVNGPYIHGVQAAMLDAAGKLVRHEFSTPPYNQLVELNNDEMQAIANIWMRSFRASNDPINTPVLTRSSSDITALPSSQDSRSSTTIIQRSLSTSTQKSSFGVPNFFIYQEDSSYVHRQLLEQAVQQRLPQRQPDNNNNRLLVISGLGGSGKTFLAQQFAHQTQQHSLVIWINAETVTQLEQELKNIALSIQEHFQVTILPATEEPTQQAAKRIQHWLSQQSNYLLVFDNVDNYQTIKAYLPTAGGDIVITSRDTQWTPAPINMSAMSPTEAAQLLIYLSQQDAANQDDVETLANELGYLPLALAQAAAYICQTGISFSDYLRLYRETRSGKQLRQDSSLSQQPGHEHDPVAITWQIHLKQLDGTSIDFLQICALMEPTAIPAYLLKDLLQCDEVQFNSIKRQLKQHSLIQIDTQSQNIHIHRVLQDVINDNNTHLAQTIDRLSSRLLFHFQYNRDQLLDQRAQFEQLLPHVTRLINKAQQHKLFNEQLAQLAYTTGMHHLDHEQQPATAVHFFEVAYSYRQQANNDALGLADAALQLGNAKLRANNHDATAIDNVKLAIRLRQEALGAEHKSLIRPLLQLANYYLYHDQADNCLSMIQQAQRINGNDENSDTAMIHHYYGNYFYNTAKLKLNVIAKYPHYSKSWLEERQQEADQAFAQAKQSYQTALRIKQQLGSINQFEIARTCKQLGSVCYSLKQFADSADYHQQALAIFCQLYTNQTSPIIAKQYQLLGEAQLKAGVTTKEAGISNLTIAKQIFTTLNGETSKEVIAINALLRSARGQQTLTSYWNRPSKTAGEDPPAQPGGQKRKLGQ